MSHKREKTHDVHKQLWKTNEIWKGQKNKGKPNGLNFAKFGVVVAYKMWKNTCTCKQLHENKKNVKSKKMDRKNLWRLCVVIVKIHHSLKLKCNNKAWRLNYGNKCQSSELEQQFEAHATTIKFKMQQETYSSKCKNKRKLKIQSNEFNNKKRQDDNT